MPTVRSILVAVALAIAATFPLAPAAHAGHSCNLDDYPVLDQTCESHGIDHPLIRKIVCLISPTC
jgi:hypothetical protein